MIGTNNFKKQEEEEAKLYPELNQGLEVFNEAGEWVIGKKKEQFSAIAWRYIKEGVLAELKGNTVKVLLAIASLTGKQRFTKAGNECISEYAGVDIKTVKKSLKELEFYHFIKRNLIPSGSLKKRKRRIVLQRWDTAKALLINDKRIIVNDKGKVIFVIPNPFKKYKIPF